MSGYQQLLCGEGDHDTVARLVGYAELLERWSARQSLVRFRSREELVRRHLLESLAAAPLDPRGGRLVDVGSGAGLPGIPLLCVSPQWTGVLVEPRQRRWAFLRLVIRELGLAAEVVRKRFSDVAIDGGATLVTARALGGYEALVGWARDELSESGRVAIWGTVELETELRRLSGWRVLSSPLVSSEQGRLIEMYPCFT